MIEKATNMYDTYVSRRAKSDTNSMRKLDGYDNIFIGMKIYLQYSLEFEDRKYVGPAVADLVRLFNAFRLCGESSFLTVRGQTPVVHEIPAKLESLDDVNKWMFKTHTPSPTETLATIAADDRRIVVNACHACNDGRYVAGIIEHITNPMGYGTRRCPSMPRSLFKHFEKQIAGHAPNSGTAPVMSRLIPRDPVADKDYQFRIHYIRESLNDLACFDRSKNRCVGMTDSMWTSMYLANAAHQQSLGSCGISTVLDMRRILPKSEWENPEYQNYVAALPVTAKPMSGMTVGELGRQMRRDFDAKFARREYFANLKQLQEPQNGDEDQTPGLGLELSNIGVIRLRSPVKDAHISLRASGEEGMCCISCMAYTIDHLDRQTSQLVAELQYTTAELAERDAQTIGESIRYGIRNFTGSENIGAAVNELRDLQLTKTY